jgi:hypothetical protein
MSELTIVKPSLSFDGITVETSHSGITLSFFDGSECVAYITEHNFHPGDTLHIEQLVGKLELQTMRN